MTAAEFFLSNHFIALATGGLIFLITIILASKELINFPLTVLFLLFAIAAAIGIENYDLFRMMETRRSPELQLNSIVNDNIEMKAEMERQSRKLQHLIDATESYIQTEKENKATGQQGQTPGQPSDTEKKS